MKTLSYALPATALFASTALAWWPDCAWNDCVGTWNGTSCTKSSGWDCVCSDTAQIDKLNTCIASSCTNQTDAEAVYLAIAQICANAGATITASPEATFSATSGGSAWPTITGSGIGPGGWGPGASGWSSWVSACSTALPGAPGGWSSGAGPWGGPGGWSSGSHPWGTGQPNCAWSTWTAGWGPFSSWTGTWSGCGSTTATPVPATVTTTVSGQVLTGTTFGVQAVQTASATPSVTTDNAAPQLRGVGASGALAVAIVGAVMAL